MSDSYRKLPEEDGDMPTNGSLTVGEEDSVRIIEEEYDGVDVASIRKIQRAMEVVSLDQDDDDAPSKKLDDILLEEDASLSKKLYVVTSIAVPVGASLFLWLIGNFITLGFAGRFPGTQDEKTVTFAGISLATVFYNVALLSIINGMATGIETLASHHNGAGDYRGVGLVLQRSMAVGAAFVIPMLPIVYFSGDLVLLVGIDPAVAKVFAKFIAVRALSCPADVFNESYRRYLTAMGLVNPTVAFAVVFNSLVLLMDFAFVRAGFSFECLAWSLVVCSYIGAGVMYLLSLRYDEVQRTLIPLDSGALTQWGTYISLGLPGLLMLCSEWWAYELLTFMAGMLGKESLAAQTIIVQVLNPTLTLTLTLDSPLFHPSAARTISRFVVPQ
jgi:MATE family multidrug resistance protein